MPALPTHSDVRPQPAAAGDSKKPLVSPSRGAVRLHRRSRPGGPCARRVGFAAFAAVLWVVTALVPATLAQAPGPEPKSSDEALTRLAAEGQLALRREDPVQALGHFRELRLLAP